MVVHGGREGKLGKMFGRAKNHLVFELTREKLQTINAGT